METQKNENGWPVSYRLNSDDVVDTGLIWYINRVALHPRGIALGIDLDGGALTLFSTTSKEIIGFSSVMDDEKHNAFEEFLAKVKSEADSA